VRSAVILASVVISTCFFSTWLSGPGVADGAGCCPVTEIEMSTAKEKKPGLTLRIVTL